MKDRPRPLSITIIGWIFVIFGSIALVSGLLPMVNATTAQRVADLKSHWIIHVSRTAQIVAGLFLLRGRNWARWLLVVWIAFHIVIGALHGVLQLSLHVAIFSVILFFLFRKPASEYLAYTYQPLDRQD
jgi:uncharacterized membrane protein HdeD (DUF308 family)